MCAPYECLGKESLHRHLHNCCTSPFLWCQVAICDRCKHLRFGYLLCFWLLPPPFSVAHEWSGSYPSYLCGSLEIGANFIPWQHRLTTSLCWQTSPKSRPVGIGNGGGAGLVTVQFWTLTNESTVKTALQRASVFILSPIPATWDTSFCIDEHPLLSLVAWNKRAEPLWPPQVWSSMEN